MLNAPIRTVFDEVTDFLASERSAHDIIAYHLSSDLQERADYLAERNRENLLTPRERQELDAFVQINRLFSLLKAKVKRPL